MSNRPSSNRPSSSRLFAACVLVVTATLAACTADEAPPEPTGSSESAIMVGEQRDCPTELGACYVGCQGVTPTPTEGCFADCGTTFSNCLANPDAPAPIYN